MPVTVDHIATERIEVVGWHSGLDLPTKGVSAAAVTIAGWFVLPGVRDVRILVTLREFDNKVLHDVRAAPRADVGAAFALAGNAALGFELRVHRFDLPPAFTLDVWLSYTSDAQDACNALFASIAGTNQPQPGTVGHLTPIYVAGLGRSGTTVLTRMLGAHPNVACGEKYPLELCISTFHAKLAYLGASVYDPSLYTMASLFSDASQLVGPNPFAQVGYTDIGTLDQILRCASDEFVAAAERANDAWYAGIAGKASAAHFVEKTVPGRALVNALNAYPNALIVLLVRHPRDVFLSRYRFNRKRGWKDFGEEGARDFSHWADIFAEECRALARVHAAFDTRVAGVVRYEDLMADSQASLTRLCSELGISAGEDVIKQMATEGSDLSGAFEDHRTDGNAPLPSDLSEATEKIVASLAEFLDRYRYAG